MLVIDILTFATTEMPPAQTKEARAAEDETAGLVLSMMARPESSAARLVASGIAPPLGMTQTGMPPIASAPDDILRTARRTLLEQIAQSANQGLVEPVRLLDHVAEPLSPPTPLSATVETMPPDDMAPGTESRLIKVLPLTISG